MVDKTRKGARFSHTYICKEAPLKDSKKARFRIAKLSERLCSWPRPKSLLEGLETRQELERNCRIHVVESIESELGICFSRESGPGVHDDTWDQFWDRIKVFEMLDAITVFAKAIPFIYRREEFIKGVQRIFCEENLAYKIDELGGAHPLIDATFTAATASTIAELSGERYMASLDEVLKIDQALLQDPRDYKEAIRSIFRANENLFKVMYQEPRLDAKRAHEKIGKDQQALYNSNPTLQRASAKALPVFEKWIDASHFYRHGEGIEKPSQPPEEVAILMISQGLSYVRWLAQLDKLLSRPG